MSPIDTYTIMNPVYITLKAIQVVGAATLLLLLKKADDDIKNSHHSQAQQPVQQAQQHDPFPAALEFCAFIQP